MLETKPPKSTASLTHTTILSPKIWVVQLLYPTSTQQVTCLGHGRTPAGVTLNINYSPVLNIYVPSCMSLPKQHASIFLCLKASKHCALSLTTYRNISLLTWFDWTPKVQWASAPQNQLCKARCCILLPFRSEEQCQSSSCQGELRLLRCSVPRLHAAPPVPWDSTGVCVSWFRKLVLQNTVFLLKRDEFPADHASDCVNHAQC